MHTANHITILISELGSNDGDTRERARNMIVGMGRMATAPMIKLLRSEHEHIRWEACKALGAIKDPASASALSTALQDEDIEVQWLAAEALIALGTHALIPLVQALKMHFESSAMRRGAYHVLRALERDYTLNDMTLQLLNTLRSRDPVIMIAWAAYKALQSLKEADGRSAGIYHTDEHRPG